MRTAHAEATLSAISLYESVAAGNDINKRNILTNTPAVELLEGLVSLLGGVLHSYAVRMGVEDQEVLDLIRAAHLDQS